MEWLPPGWCPRVVAFDIDGTLTDENKRLDMHAVEALRRLEDAGIPVILATGSDSENKSSFFMKCGIEPTHPLCALIGVAIGAASAAVMSLRPNVQDIPMSFAGRFRHRFPPYGLDGNGNGNSLKTLKKCEIVKRSHLLGTQVRTH